MNKLAAACLAAALFDLCGCRTCIPCKIGEHNEKAKIETQKAVDNVDSQPAPVEEAE